jgi:calcineurin-like phosphoesterase family protein
VLHLGDLCYKSNAQFKHILAPELTGKRKLLILGNHDRQRFSFYRDCGFKITKPFEMNYDGPDAYIWRVSFSHYPLKQPDGIRRHVHLHGHIHNNGYGGKHSPFTPFSAGQINLSVEQTKYRPVNLKVLLDGYIEGCYEPAV